jgi:hypothetical protein
VKNIAVLIVIGALFIPTITHAELSSLLTQTGNSISLSLSSYQYQEPGIMSLKGSKIGLDILGTQQIGERGLFIRGGLRYAFGTVDYNSNGSGNATGEPDWYIEARGLVGKDWGVKGMVLSTYTGLGYRFLFNDGRGITSAGGQYYFGYRRASNYFYLPMGIIHRCVLNNHARLVNTLEYDHLLAGRQISRLSDGGQGDGDATNTQTRGYGLKLSIMYEKDNLAIGPYMSYWNISQSDVVPSIQNGSQVYKNGLPMGWVEPNNNTLEFGFKVSQHF